MGVANDKSIAWGIAKVLAEHGAELAFTYQAEGFEKRVRPLAESVGSDLLIACDVSNEKDLDQLFDVLSDKWGQLDFVVHAVAYSDKEQLKGRFADTSLENFQNTMHVSCYSFVSLMRRAAALMPDGGAAVTLSYLGAERVVPNYNVMGVAKAALETSVRYLATDFGLQNIRVNGISAGPMKTLAGSAISGARHTYRYNQENAPLKRTPDLDDLGGSALYLLSDLSRAVTGEIHYVDCGYNTIGVPSRHVVETVHDNP
jgi:enoyl-[acyl-carrier protein] reductase I